MHRKLSTFYLLCKQLNLHYISLILISKSENPKIVCTDLFGHKQAGRTEATLNIYFIFNTHDQILRQNKAGTLDVSDTISATDYSVSVRSNVFVR